MPDFYLLTIKPHILTISLLKQFDLSDDLVGWILNLLSNRIQSVSEWQSL